MCWDSGFRGVHGLGFGGSGGRSASGLLEMWGCLVGDGLR